MRPGDVVRNYDDGQHRYQCRGCDRWVLLKEAGDAGGCSDGCCSDYRCPHCQHVTRIEWPD